MLFPFVLLAVSLVHYIHSQHTKIQLPDDLHEWCPYTTFCSSDNENHINIPDHQTNAGYRPCCEPCSCASDCGLKRQCCRSEYDKHKLDHNLKTVCKPLTTDQHISRGNEHYYIVEECPNKEISCSSVVVAKWGTFWPVYSRSSGMLYHNFHCASCHNQSDLVELLPVISFQFPTGSYSNFFSNSLIGINEESSLYFVVPDTIDVYNELCYPFMIRDCTNEQATYYNLKDTCLSFNATFRSGVLTYQNVYCYLCARYSLVSKQEWIETKTMCPGRNSQKGILKLPFTVLLDKDLIETPPKEEHAERKYVCFDNRNTSSKQTCRPVHCPEGQHRMRRSCRIFGKTWYVKKSRVMINLTLANLNEKLHVSDLLEIPEGHLASPRKEDLIQKPALRNWNVDLFYNFNGETKTVMYLVVVLSGGQFTVQPNTFLREIQKIIQGKWIITINGKAFKFNAAFNKHIHYFYSWKQMGMGPFNDFVPHWMQPETSASAEDQIRALSSDVNVNLLQPVLCVTKLFFCELIELRSDEFRMINGQYGHVYLVHNMKVLGNGEFIESIPGMANEGPYEIHVCVSDVIDGTASSDTDSIKMLIVLFCFLHFVMFIM